MESVVLALAFASASLLSAVNRSIKVVTNYPEIIFQLVANRKQFLQLASERNINFWVDSSEKECEAVLARLPKRSLGHASTFIVPFRLPPCRRGTKRVPPGDPPAGDDLRGPCKCNPFYQVEHSGAGTQGFHVNDNLQSEENNPAISGNVVNPCVS